MIILTLSIGYTPNSNARSQNKILDIQTISDYKKKLQLLVGEKKVIKVHKSCKTE